MGIYESLTVCDALDLSRLHLSYHSLSQSVHAIGVVFLGEAGTESPGESLVETGFHRSEEGLDELVGRGAALAVHQLDAELALRIGELLHSRRVFLLDAFLHQLHVGILRLLVGEGFEIFARLDDNLSHFLGDGEHLLHVIHQSVVSQALLVVLEGRLWIDIYIIYLYILYAVAAIQYLSHLHHRLEGRVVHIHLPVLRAGLIVLGIHLQGEAQ